MESVQLCACKYILGCSVTIWDEPVHADLGLQTLKCRRDFHRLKWYNKIMCMSDKRLPGKLLSNKWNNKKCKGCPRKSWIAQGDSLRKELNLQDKVLSVNQIKRALDQRECEEFEVALQHKSKLHVYRELKREVGFEDYFCFLKISFRYPWAI